LGFRREAFTNEQRQKLDGLVGNAVTGGELSFYMANYFTYFLFFSCEVKSSAAALDIADPQNAHSMRLAVRGVVELFRTVGRQKDIDREILAFSISHDLETVRIYGHTGRSKADGPRHVDASFLLDAPLDGMGSGSR
jgi:hypothetical protein